MSKKRFACTFCHKDFSRSDYLSRHLANHAAVRPYSCEQCNVSFARRDLRDKHLKSKSHQTTIELLRSQNATRKQPPQVAKEDKLQETSPDSYDWLFGHYNNYDLPTPSLDEPLIDPVYPDSTHVAEPSQSLYTGVYNEETIAIILDLLQMPQLKLSLSPVTVSYFADLFWTHFDANYPIIHKPLFSCRSHPFLLTMVIVIGMVYSKSSTNIDIAVQIQRKLLKLQMDTLCDSPDLRLDVMQSFLLTCYFSSNVGDVGLQKQAKLFHGTIIGVLDIPNLTRSLREPPLYDAQTLPADRLVELWKNWIQYESLKRLAFFAYICDSQLAYLHECHALISIFDLQLDLPYTDAVWAAADAETFADEYLKQPRELIPRRKQFGLLQLENWINIMPHVKEEGSWPNFLFSLRRLMQPYREHQKEYNMNCFSQFSRLIFLQGLISITWDLRWKGLQDLGIVSKRKMDTLTLRLQDAYNQWREYFDFQITTTNNIFMNKNDLKSTTLAYLNRYDTSPIFWNNLTQYQFGLLLLHVDTIAVYKLASQYADAVSAENPHPRISASAKIQSWIRSQSSQASLSNACKLLRTVSLSAKMIFSIPHLAKYVATSCLVLWCYETFREDIPLGIEKNQFPNPIRYMHHGMISQSITKEDTLQYLNLIIEREELMGAEYEFTIRQQCIQGLLCYFSLLLDLNEWKSLDINGSLLRRLVFKKYLS
ncbi:hypothetical protein KL929_004832 [Ogataea haglerorum]|nr:hypothetical protein KL912_001792 [Ogataea haglerorum]KAG7794488.1 hypothetical protein KL929_004832 [Ogataea haglerorum]